MGANPRFGHIWKNVYSKHDYQDVHIHPNCQWSFVIYVDTYSKTSFLNPSMKDIQNQIGNMYYINTGCSEWFQPSIFLTQKRKVILTAESKNKSHGMSGFFLCQHLYA